MTHTFKPYADAPDFCVAELPNGETCNAEREMHLAVELHAAIKEIRTLQSDCALWCETNEAICGYDDATWFDTIAEYDAKTAEAAIRLTNLVEQLIGVKE